MNGGGRELVLGNVVRPLLKLGRVFPQTRLHKGLLIDQEERVRLEEALNLPVLLAPAALLPSLIGVLALRDDYHWGLVVPSEPIAPDTHLILVLEAQGLRVPLVEVLTETLSAVFLV